MKYCTNDRALRQDTSHGNVEEAVVVVGNAMDSKMQKKKTNNYDKVVQKKRT